MSSIVLGVAALVAINSFNYNLRQEIDREAATLLGADLAATSNKVAEPEILTILDSLPGEKAREMEMLSMSYIPKTDETQFVRLKALEGDYPFYGTIKTDPANAAKTYKNGPYALVDESLMLQHSLTSGDSIKLGNMMFEIKGKLSGAVGSIGAASAVAPAIYISLASLDSTGLVQPGSLVNYAYYYKVPQGFNVEKWKSSRKKLFRSESLRVETIEDRKENLNQAFGFLNNFLNLIAVVALLLGCIGVASSVFIYVKSKYNAIALLRCIGMKSDDAFLIYFIQIMSLGLLAVISGVITGVAIQSLLPLILKDFLPVKVNMGISATAIFEGFTIGLVVTSLFSLVPLVSIRTVSPLRILRSSVEENPRSINAIKMVLYAIILVALSLFMWMLTDSLLTGILFVAGILLTYFILSGISVLVTGSLRKMIPERAGFILKQGMSNLFRPDNQTQTIMVTIGMGTAVLTTMIILQSLLLNNVSLMDEGKQPNMILYGIENQSDGRVEVYHRKIWVYPSYRRYLSSL
jgi:putative ABC transport system permease protein